jgi:hypothetical protein
VILRRGKAAGGAQLTIVSPDSPNIKNERIPLPLHNFMAFTATNLL